MTANYYYCMLQKRLLLIAFLCYGATLAAQIKVTIIVDKLPAFQNSDPVYVAGNFNSWNPSDNSFKLKQQPGGEWQSVINSQKDNILEFKFTRGAWTKVECTAEGKDLGNHSLKVAGDTTLRYTIGGWQDAFAPKSKRHTASAQVQVMDSAFKLKALGRDRRIWIYLPKDYATSKKRYPVLYMHDGQNLFDEFTAGYGEWGVDELLDAYFDETKKSCIVIGIDNGTKRMTEYDPYDNERFGKGEGKAYVQSIVESLKPFVDKRYRTIKDASNTWIAGSSMGGIISQWAVMAYPKVFGKAGIFSPAFWVAPAFKTDVSSMMKGYAGELYFYSGEKESKTMVPDMDSVMMKVKGVSKAALIRSVTADGQHNEQNWNRVFPEFMKMVFE
ncbi:MAG: alpha/beta hydrolase-fold protein [Bacteroidota bacterium]